MIKPRIKQNRPYCFVIFNRPDTTRRVFEQIRAAKPLHLYVAADGARTHKAGEQALCVETLAILNDIDWDCQVETLLHYENLGCREAVSSAIDWFFSNEEEGIILEDDCLPANSFFKFCDELLEKYRNDTRIRHITGCNLQQGAKWGDATYYFSNRTHVWGWASWKRVWKDYDKTLSRYDSQGTKECIKNIYADPLIVESWVNIFNDVKAEKINSWAYPLDFANFFNNGLIIIPNENLISNIGFGAGATHTADEDNIYSNIPLAEIDEIIHPQFLVAQKDADLAIMNRDFKVDERRRKENLLRKKIERAIKSSLKVAASLAFLS